MTKPEEEAAVTVNGEDKAIAALRDWIASLEGHAGQPLEDTFVAELEAMGAEFEVRQGVFHRLTLAGVTAETSRPELLLGAWCATARQAILDAEPAAAEAEGVA